MRRAAPLALLALLLAACGQKGNLYLPDQDKAAVVVTPAASAPAAQPAASPAPADPAQQKTEENAKRN